MKTRLPAEGKEESNANDDSKFIKKIEKCRNGATKEDIINIIPLLSHQISDSEDPLSSMFCYS